MPPWEKYAKADTATPAPKFQPVTMEGMRAAGIVPPKKQPVPRKPGVVEDSAKSFALSGVPKGAAGVFGSIGDVQELARNAGEFLADRAGVDVEATKANTREAFGKVPLIGDALAGMVDTNPFVTSKQINDTVQGVTGDYYVPQTRAGRYSEKIGEFVPNAFAPGGPIRKAAQVVVPAVASQGAGDAAAALGFGDKGQAAAQVLGAMIGGVAVPAAARPKLPGTVEQNRPLVQLNKAAGQDVPAMRAKAAQYREAGLSPTLVDVTNEPGVGYLSGAALRMPARAAARAYGSQKRTGLPGEISNQARRVMSDDARTPMQIAEDLAASRNAAADASFGAVRGETFQMPPEMVQALRTDYGKAAIAEAARRERDPEVRAALLRLSADALDNPSTQVSVGMADRIARVLNGQARAAGGDSDLAATLGGLGRSVRDPARAAVPGYGKSVDEYAAASRLMGAAERGEDFLKRNTDEFAADMAGYSDAERFLPRSTGRRAIERAAGESLGSAPSVAERIAYAPEQQARNRALLGEADARRLEEGMGLAHDSWRRAQAIDPGMGSPTAPKSVAADAVAGAVETGVNTVQALKGNAVPLARQLLKAKGLNDQQAARLVEMATDPEQLDDVLLILEARVGQQGAQEFLRLAREGAPLAAPALLTTAGSE